MYKVTIPMKLPGLNEYINACRSNKYMAAAIKKRTQADIIYFLTKLPKFEQPIRIKFLWISKLGDRRDLDNICFAKKFILDAMQECGKISNDNRKCVVGFIDEFEFGKEYEVSLEIEEVKVFEMEVKNDN